jgi:hypothetical protein
MVAEPELTPVTTPVVAFTVATPIFPEVQLPPPTEVFNVNVDPSQTSVDEPVIVGTSFTVTITWSVFTQALPSVPVTV